MQRIECDDTGSCACPCHDPEEDSMADIIPDDWSGEAMT